MRAIYSYLLSSIEQDYKTIRTLKSSERGCVSLLQNRQNGTRFIFRHYRGNGEVYRKLLGISCPNLPQIMEAAEQDGIRLYISSGFRSYETQDRIYRNHVTNKGQERGDLVSARPGHSEHQTGLAFDVNIIDSSFIGTPEAIWLEDNCYRFGFILRYPENKTDETGYAFEPWHFRYVGRELAEALYHGGDWLTIEDYFGITSAYDE